jgi:hypothetical protein
LAGGLPARGADSVIATLWAVDDRQASPLMSAVHRRLAAGATGAEALHYGNPRAKIQTSRLDLGGFRRIGELDRYAGRNENFVTVADSRARRFR